MKNITALIGDYWHPADYIEKGLKMALNHEGFELNLIDDYEKLDWENLDSVGVLILAQSASKNKKDLNDKSLWIKPKYEAAIASYVDKGGGFLVLHSGLAGYPNNSIYRKVVKGHFIHHPTEHPEVKISLKPVHHPILEGIKNFEVVDEQYFVEWDVEDTTTLMEGMSTEFGSSATVWAHTYGKGRVCCLTPGHTEDVLCHEMMQRLILNAAKWCMKE